MNKTPLQQIGRNQLCVTNGTISSLPNGELVINSPSARAVLFNSTAQSAEIRFRYLGPTTLNKPLASGELRRQIGLKLKAQDTCNLLYIMWHIEPDSNIAVAIKSNPNKHTHAQCGATGYIPIKPRHAVKMPKILPGEMHSLRAELHNSELTLIADGNIVWEGNVGNEINEMDGTVGLRSDNGRFEFTYFTESALSPHPTKVNQQFNQCQPIPGD